MTAVETAWLLQLLHGNTSVCGTDALHATHVPPSWNASADGTQQQQLASKRSYSTLMPEIYQSNRPQEVGAVDTAAAKKKNRQSPGGQLPGHQCVADAARTNVHLPISSLFKPSKKLELFATSPKLDPGAAWIVTWLP